MKNLITHLKESLLSSDFEDDLDNAVQSLAMDKAFRADNRTDGSRSAEFNFHGNEMDIKIDKNGFTFSNRMNNACRKLNIDTVNIMGEGIFYLTNATNLTFNVQISHHTLLGGLWNTKSLIKDCIINCNEIKIESNERGKKDVSNTTINAKVAIIASSRGYSWSGVEVKAPKVIIPCTRFEPMYLNPYVDKSKYDFEKDFDYVNRKTRKKTSWSPLDMFKDIKVQSDLIVLQSPTENPYWFDQDGQRIENKSKTYVSYFRKESPGEFGGYTLHLDEVPTGNNPFKAIKYIENLK